jgi:hypothetical protein
MAERRLFPMDFVAKTFHVVKENACSGKWLRLRLTALILLALVWPRETQAMGLGPSLSKVQNIAPGKLLDLKKRNLTFFVINDGDKELKSKLFCEKPWSWEAGYEKIPDTAWCHLEKEELTLPAHSRMEIGLTINVPDKPENYNRKWDLMVLMNMGHNKNPFGLSVPVRVFLETLPSADSKSALGAPIGTAPSALDLAVAPGEHFSGTFLLRNNLATDLRCIPERLVQVYPDQEIKYERYISPDYKDLLKESWLTIKYEPFTLKTETNKEFKISGQVPASAQPGERWEDLIFFRGDVEQDKDKDEDKDKNKNEQVLRTFVRIRLTIKGPDKKD